MSTMKVTAARDGEVRADFVPKSDYLSASFAELEKKRLWPRVWQIACREEEIPKPGDYVTYDIQDESIIVVRTAEGDIRAHHNACPHRGRRLTTGCGSTKEFVCGFHGWRFDHSGSNTYIQDPEDWGTCLKKGDADLASVKVGRWAGWVWINMDPDSEPLETFLEPVIARCDKFELDRLRFRWSKSTRLDCNWKVVIEAFDEGYHVAGTHPQLLNYTEDYTEALQYGLHGAFFTSLAKAESGVFPLQRSRRRGGVPDGADYRKFLEHYTTEFTTDLKAMVTENAVAASKRLMEEVPADAPQGEVVMKWAQFQREAAEARGIRWPDLTPEYVAASHQDWHIFPNTVCLHASVDGVLWYRARPDGDNVDSCIFDVWSLELFGENEEPPELVREFYDDWREGDFGKILEQDFANVSEVHRGMKSRGFKGSRTNPVQEVAISNFHRGLREFMEQG